MKNYIVSMEDRRNKPFTKIYILTAKTKFMAKICKWLYHFKYDNLEIREWYT